MKARSDIALDAVAAAGGVERPRLDRLVSGRGKSRDTCTLRTLVVAAMKRLGASDTVACAVVARNHCLACRYTRTVAEWMQLPDMYRTESAMARRVMEDIDGRALQ